MEFNRLKLLSELPEEKLVAKLVGLFREVLKFHDNNKGLRPFDWTNLEMSADGEFFLADVAETILTDDVRYRNYADYAAIIYCVCTRQKSAESMSWDAGRKIKHSVLREIVLTICGRNNSVFPLVEKLREPYIDEESFFEDYSTVDEKEASDAYMKSEQIRRQNEIEDGMNARRSFSSKSSLIKGGVGGFVLMFICFSGYRAYMANEELKQSTASQQTLRQSEVMRQFREPVRTLSVDINSLHAKEDSTVCFKENIR